MSRDWDGVNDYEKLRAKMVAEELGYIGFAADIYGKDLHTVENITMRSELATLYRSNVTLFANRIQAAVDVVRTFDEVDVDNVAIMGYCFGGTGVLIYALEGVNDVKAVVSFHGGLSMIPDAGPVVEPKVLVLSGGDDDTSTEIIDLEMTLDMANATWEITRYSDIQHAFTVFDDERYNEWADMRSWESMKEFLAECFGEKAFESNPPTSVDVEAVNYTDVDGTELMSYIAMPSMNWQRPLPAVLIIPYVRH
jgi:dienelactone hydrolase